MTRAGLRKARARLPLAAVTVALATLPSCGATPAPIGPRGIDELTIPTPSPDPGDFSGHAENVWFPLGTGTSWVYRQYLPTGLRTVVATVAPHHRRIEGIEVTAVRWAVRDGPSLHPAMVRWYAVDSAGDVWWFGQRVVPHSPRLDTLARRSWTAGRGGAEAGLVLSAEPRVGDGYWNARQPRVVERRSVVQSVTATVATARRTFRDTVATQDLSSLAPLHVVQTYYSRGLGMVAQQDTRAASTSLTLVRIRRPASGG